MLKVITASVIALALVSVMSYPVSAQTAEQSQNLEVKCDTTTGSYGQNTTTSCKAIGGQNQKITFRKGVKPVAKADIKGTGLDTATTVAGTLTLAGGAIAAWLRVRNQA